MIIQNLNEIVNNPYNWIWIMGLFVIALGLIGSIVDRIIGGK